MSAGHFAQVRRDLVRRLRRDLAVMSLLLPIGLGVLYLLVFDSWMFGHDGRMRRTTAEVQALATDVDGDPVARLRYTDHLGRVHVVEHEYEPPRELAVGERVGYAHSVSGRPNEVLLHPSMGLVRWILGGLAAFVFACLAAMLATVLVRYRRRRWLVEHGRRETGVAPAIETRVLLLGKQVAEMWRLRLRRFEPTQAAWIDYRSDWQSGLPPRLDADTPMPPILIDPRRPSNYWLPVGALAQEHAFKS